jgi:cytochrome c-type biogenesis protein CcmH
VTTALRTVAVAAVLGGLVALSAAATPVDEKTVHEIAADLRCVVCQSLSVADSPSETANQMRGIIRERLAAGDTPDQVRAYFVERYGQWILLAPPRRGFDLLVWIAPFAALVAGVGLVVAMVTRWSRRARAARAEIPAVDEDTRARIAREMAEMDR